MPCRTAGVVLPVWYHRAMSGAPTPPPGAPPGGPASHAATRAKLRAERLAIGGAAGLAVLKLGTGLAIGSIGLVSAAADSLLDVVISSLNLFSLRIAAAPADSTHPYGHGKVESLAGLAQAVTIGLIGGALVVAAIRRLLAGIRPEHAGWGIAVMILSAAASWLISRHLRKVARATDSVVLLADALHYATDVWTNGGVLLALVLVLLTGSPVFDPLVAILVGGFIGVSAYRLLARSVHDLMDAALPEAERREIERIVRGHRFVVALERLRTRRSGSVRQIDFTVVACRHLPLGEAHDLVAHIEGEIAASIPEALVVVHAAPCAPDCVEAERCIREASERDLLAHEHRS